MARFLLAVMCATLPLLCHAQDANSGKSTDRSGLAEILSFEAQHTAGFPGGWGGGPAGTIFVDGKIVHGGQWSARIERYPDSPGTFSTITKSIVIDFVGTTIELHGFLRTEDVSDFVGLWMREDGESPGVAFDNMQSRQLKGTTGWSEYSIALPLRGEAKQLFFGFLVSGTGKAWVDDRAAGARYRRCMTLIKQNRIDPLPFSVPTEFGVSAGLTCVVHSPFEAEVLTSFRCNGEFQ